jgi:hypothetical protein
VPLTDRSEDVELDRRAERRSALKGEGVLKNPRRRRQGGLVALPGLDAAMSFGKHHEGATFFDMARDRFVRGALSRFPRAHGFLHVCVSRIAPFSETLRERGAPVLRANPPILTRHQNWVVFPITA